MAQLLNLLSGLQALQCYIWTVKEVDRFSAILEHGHPGLIASYFCVGRKGSKLKRLLAI